MTLNLMTSSNPSRLLSIRITRLAVFAATWLAFSTGLQAQTPLPTPRAVDVFITITKGECKLLESGIGVTDTELEANKRRGMVAVDGSFRDEEVDVYRCSVEVSEEPLKSGLTQCALSGFNAASTNPLWFKGDVNRVTRSCNAYRLRNGNFYFSATGISSDICSWTCTLR